MFIRRFLQALTGVKIHRRSIVDDINDARHKAGLPRLTYNAKRWY